MDTKKEDKKIMTITEIECWKCKKKIRISIVIDGGVVHGPDEFSEKEIEFAKSKDVVLKKQFSKTLEETYLANTCGYCDSFVGDHFLHDYLYMQDEEYEII
jgi:hypothetical protein